MTKLIEAARGCVGQCDGTCKGTRCRLARFAIATAAALPGLIRNDHADDCDFEVPINQGTCDCGVAPHNAKVRALAELLGTL